MKKSTFILNLILILALSLSAGFFISTKVYNDQWQNMMLKVTQALEDKRFNLIESSEDSKILTESEAYNLNKQIYLVAKEKSQTTSGDVLNQVYFDQDFIAYATVITNDGWLVTNNDLKKTDTLVVINNEKEIIPVLEVINDPVLGINYLKIDKTGLNPIAITDSNNLEIGEIVYGIKPNLYNYQHEIIVNSIQNLHTRIIKNKADLIYKAGDIIYGLLNDEIDDGLPLVNNKSQFIGFSVSSDNQSYLLPSKYIRYSLTRLFDNNYQIIYPSLGINYLDLSELVLDGDLPNKGALVYNVIEKDNLFKKGDIITKVENDEINKVRALNDVLLDYKIGSKLKFLVIREGQEIELEIIIKGFNE